MAKSKSILLIIGGGIAAYKSLFLIRELARRGISTRAVLTRAGAEFVTPLSVGALTADRIYSDLFDLTAEAEMGHIELSRSADLVVVAPATADLMAKAANGLANDLASTTLLATDKPVLFAPAMNVRMWEHPATQRNLAQLREDGALFVGPNEGDMACGEFGPGRMAEPSEIADAVQQALAGDALAGRHVLITAGPTREPIDPVRYLSNHSSGKQGYALARACRMAGACVTLVSGPTDLPAPPSCAVVRVETAAEMMAACEKALPADIFISVAAVADWRPEGPADKKIKKGKTGIGALALTENPDILKTIVAHKDRPRLVIGFAAETNDLQRHASAKLKKKGCDWIIANDISGDIMGGDENQILLLTPGETQSWPRMTKTELAEKIVGKIASTLE